MLYVLADINTSKGPSELVPATQEAIQARWDELGLDTATDALFQYYADAVYARADAHPLLQKPEPPPKKGRTP